MRPRIMFIVPALFFGLGMTGVCSAQPADVLVADYVPADHGQRPAARGVQILPEKFLRSYDPVTVYFSSNKGPGRGPADHGNKLLKITPRWPGAWTWLDRKTLQFRPAEPWPALARFQVRSGKVRKILRTMMEAPLNMSPPKASRDLLPFRTFTLVFSQALDLDYLRKMLSLQIREQPGLKTSKGRTLSHFAISRLPRAKQNDPVSYAISLDKEVSEGQMLVVQLSLALGERDRVLWSARLSVQAPFHVESIQCGSSVMPASGDSRLTQDMALACGNSGQTPQLVFSAPVKDMTLSQLKKLVHLDPAVEALSFEPFGKRVALRGKFLPDVLYRIKLESAPIRDLSDRALLPPGQVTAFFYLGWKEPFLRWEQAKAILEAKGPRMVPVVGFGEPRVDLRIYRIDPLYRGLWPFPSTPVLVNEQAPPPFPGEEPALDGSFSQPSSWSVDRNIRMLGSPLVSRVQELGLEKSGATSHLGIDIGPLLDKAVGKNKPGHYLVGIRRLTGPTQRAYLRVQLTDLSLTSVEERDRVVFFVRSLADASAVKKAEIVLELVRRAPASLPGKAIKPMLETIRLVTDSQGKAVLGHQAKWDRIYRLSVRKGQDVLVIDPNSPPLQFANNHWSSWGSWLNWIQSSIPPPANDATVGFVFTERPIYRPLDTVHIMGYVRKKRSGKLVGPGDSSLYALRIRAPSGKEWLKSVKFSSLKGFSLDFQDKDAPTGNYSVTLEEKKSQRFIAQRYFRIEAYRIPKFEVQLVAPERVSNDKPFEVKAVARYYAGGSVANRPIRWSVRERPYYHVPKGLTGYLFASSLQFSRQGRTHAAQTISTIDSLDDKGANKFKADPSQDLDGSAKIYRFEASVTGVDKQMVSATQEVKALPPFLLGMKIHRYMEKPGVLRPAILAVGVDDKPLKGQKVTLRLYRRTWHSHLRETDFTTGKASYVTDKQDTKIKEMEIVTGKVPVRPSLKLGRSGVYVVELISRDRLGRVQTLSADLYVGGKDALAWRKSKEGLFELSLDKKKYKPGETAKLILKSPFTKARALVVVEQAEGNELKWVNVRGSKAVVPIDIGAKNVPNLPVHVVLMRGRIGSGAKDDSRYRPRTLAASKDIEVEPVSNRVKADIVLPKVARPGSSVKISVTLSDERSRPLSGEVTLWMVDEAVLSLAPEAPLKPLDWLIKRNRRRTAIRDTRNMVIGRLTEREEPSGDGADGDERDRLRGKHRVRKNFKTVPFFKATMKVGKSGKITIPVKLSDDLTSFQVRVVAASGMERFGFSHKRLRVRLPILVQAMLPRFVRDGDMFMAGGVGRVVEGASGAGLVAVGVQGDVIPKSARSTVSLKKGKPVTKLIPVRARLGDGKESGAIKVKMEVERKSDRVGDAFEVKLPVLPDRVVQHVAFFKDIKKQTVTMNPLPEKPRPGSTRQKLLVSSAPEAVKLLAAVDYLVDYPHGCLEQQLSSLIAQIRVSGALKSLGLDEGLYSKVKENAAHMLGQLKVFQNERGFFSFWPGGTGRVFLTAKALEFLHLAQGMGLSVDQAQVKASIGALRRVLRSDYSGLVRGYEYDQQTSALRALARVGELDDNYLLRLYHHRDDMFTNSGVNLALALASEKDRFSSETLTMKKWLWDHVVFQLYHGKEIFKEIRDSRTLWGGWYILSLNSNLADVLYALVTLDPDNPKVRLVSQGLMASASADQAFGNTYDNSKAVQALVAYIENSSLDSPAATVDLGKYGAMHLGPNARLAHREFKSDRPLTLKVDSSVPLLARVSYSYVPDVPGDQVKPRSSGLLLDRKTMVIPKAGGAPEYFSDAPGKVENLKIGDVIELQVNLVNHEKMNHVALVVPFAAGLEPLNPALANSSSEAKPSQPDSQSPSFVQRKDNEVRYYFTRLPKGRHSFFIRLRASTQGSFVHPAPWAEQMYHQQVRGRGAGMRIVVGEPLK